MLHKLLKILTKISPWHCSKCGSLLHVIRDDSGTDFGYGIWYCPKCDGDLEEQYYGKNKN